MSFNPYHRFSDKELSLNDYLAIDRTVLSNERTLLAYGRTSLAMLAVGGSCIKFFDSFWIGLIGVVFIAGALVTAVYGVSRFRRMQAYVSVALREQTGTAEHPLTDAVKIEKGEAPTDGEKSDGRG